MPIDLFIGKSSVQTNIYVFRVGEVHQKDEVVKFIDFSNDGYTRTNRKKASSNLKDTDHAKECYQEVVDLVRFGKSKLATFTEKEYYEGFNIEKLCRIVGYSRRHIDRIFKEYLNITLSVYIKAIYLTKSAKELCEERKNIIEIALNNHFDSHEGFSRSFTRRFHVSPSEYRKNRVAIPLFIQYPISHYYTLLKHMEESKMSDGIANVCMVTVTAKERRKRKLIYQKSRKAQDYFSYCEEMGCE
jgi:Transcriptional regulator containing an amidase domain and an AraC-type DNA-binding HTH domain